MWQVTGSTKKWNLSCYSPRVLAGLFGFRWFGRAGGGALGSDGRDTWYHCRREQKQDGRWCDKVPGSASLLQSREEILLWTPWVRFRPFYCALLPTFHNFSCLIPVCLSSSFSFVCEAAICYCTFSTYIRVRILPCFICILPHLGFFFV